MLQGPIAEGALIVALANSGADLLKARIDPRAEARRRRRHAFWGGGAPEDSLLHQLALATAPVDLGAG